MQYVSKSETLHLQKVEHKFVLINQPQNVYKASSLLQQFFKNPDYLLSPILEKVHSKTKRYYTEANI